MIRNLIIISMLLNLSVVSAQNYFQPYPITAVVGSNGSQQRLECSVYDSVLQNVQTYNTPWFNNTVTISANNFGQVAYTTFDSGLGNFDSTFGFVIYDYTLSQFMPVVKSFFSAPGNFVMIATDISGVNYTIVETDGGFQNIYKHYYRYDILEHEWVEINYYNGLDNNFNSSGYTHTGVRWVIDNGDLGKYWMFDPGDHTFKQQIVGCAGWYFTYEDDYLVADGSCSSTYNYTSYDPENHEWKIFRSNDACTNCFQNGGIFHASGSYDFLTFWDYFGTYDQSQNVFKIDSIDNVNIQGIVIKDRVVAYYNTSITPDRVYFKTYSPTLHTWVTDSADAQGITGVSISDGTVNWIDASGQHSMGYSDGTGWGNFSTPLQLSFHVTDLSSSTGYMMVHVRNYTIGTDSIKYDFGDGIVSSNNSKVLWHLYKNPGSYSICISNVNGTQSVCQTVSFSQCAVGGVAIASSDTLCEGDSLTLNVTGYNGAVQWQSKTASVWVDETGPGSTSGTFQIAAILSKSYRAKVTNGICIPEFSNELSVFVYPVAQAGTISINQDSICSGNTSTLSVTTTTGSIQWQSFDGSNWVNETGTGSHSIIYTVSPGISTSYRVLASSGQCTTDSSNVIEIIVFTFPDPVTTNDTICSTGIVNLTATGPGTINWYESLTSVNPISTGSLYSPVISANATYYTRASSGITFHIGATDSLIGATASVNTNYRGLRFVANAASVLDQVYVYPKSGSSNVEISLYNSTTGSFLKKVNQSVIPGSGKTAIYCGFELDPGNIYDLKYTGNTVLVYNSTNAAYPYTVPGSPVTITGALSPSFNTGPTYYFFYDWVISEGCNSNMISATGIVGQLPTPIVTSNGPLSFCRGGEVELAIASSQNASYQWNRNGIALAGDTLSTYTANTQGRYTVSVMLDTCSAVSNHMRVTVPCISQFDAQEKWIALDESLTAYFSKESSLIHLQAHGLIGETYEIVIFDNAGRVVINIKGTLTSGALVEDINGISLVSGIYTIKLITQKDIRFKRFPLIR